jgi:hypothetical protein
MGGNTSILITSPFQFKRYDQCGMEPLEVIR